MPSITLLIMLCRTAVVLPGPATERANAHEGHLAVRRRAVIRVWPRHQQQRVGGQGECFMDMSVQCGVLSCVHADLRTDITHQRLLPARRHLRKGPVLLAHRVPSSLRAPRPSPIWANSLRGRWAGRQQPHRSGPWAFKAVGRPSPVRASGRTA